MFYLQISRCIGHAWQPSKIIFDWWEVHDVVPASGLLSDFSDCNILADKDYDSTALILDLESRNVITVIPSRRNRKNLRDYDRYLYKERHLVECFFNKSEVISANCYAL